MPCAAQSVGCLAQGCASLLAAPTGCKDMTGLTLMRNDDGHCTRWVLEPAGDRRYLLRSQVGSNTEGVAWLPAVWAWCGRVSRKSLWQWVQRAHCS